MASRPLKPCSYPGCASLVKSGKCEQHKQQGQQQYDKQRGTSTQRGYDARWQKVRAIKLRHDPLCERCIDKGIVKSAALVHHKQSIRNGGAVYAMDNLMSVCVQCHDEIHREQGDKWGMLG